ncbi:DUF2680 domain-containing protein [Anaerosacchariphilus polymeriproducens]|uniref:DUF2680 domain-containing protein n=1 Tax=Anaerosacchariphilus polymeriproducens TaxID=1812858 RepID=A0A371ASV6_9FIRM|nr:DUF2680 domain-containing protein [Anaerosacchariphilus polymeriproducens]RDU22648.1 DUF2680 domain-containing protein [Anaerosacchariphilus polymeriproducens]
MNNKKRLITGCIVAAALTTTSMIAFAASPYSTPAEAVSGITGRTTESVIAERMETGKTYGAIASAAGKLDEYKKASLEMKKNNLNAQVAAGTITQDKADSIIKSIEDNQSTCDGTGTAKIGQKMGAKFGSNGAGKGNQGSRMGRGQGSGCGMNSSSSCIYQ